MAVRAQQAVVERARRAVALLHRIQHALHAFGPVFLGQRQGLGLDAHVELVLQRRARRQQGDAAQHDHRHREGRRVERRQPDAVGPEQPHSGSRTQ